MPKTNKSIQQRHAPGLHRLARVLHLEEPPVGGEGGGRDVVPCARAAHGLFIYPGDDGCVESLNVWVKGACRAGPSDPSRTLHPPDIHPSIDRLNQSPDTRPQLPTNRGGLTRVHSTVLPAPSVLPSSKPLPLFAAAAYVVDGCVCGY